MGMKLDFTPWREPSVQNLYDMRLGYSTKTNIQVKCWGGWQWYTPEGAWYRTDELGEGLFFWSSGRGNWVQVRGTMQFDLPRNRKSALQKLRRMGIEIRRIE